MLMKSNVSEYTYYESTPIPSIYEINKLSLKTPKWKKNGSGYLGTCSTRSSWVG